MNRSSLAAVSVALLALAISTGLGCAFGEFRPSDPFDRGYSLEEAQRKYTSLVRWGEFKKASAFVQEDVRDVFLRDAPSPKQLRFTDYEVGQVEIDDDTGTSTVEVTYFAYQPASPLEISVVETQHWERDGIGNNWRVRPSFSGLEDIAQSSH